ncbi:contractile injection system protein, VgrG/Pvc8 family [Sansalvadorimonas verongulae]|uniref:contractile injection system protein, VgrG/Pvc8 family n=1 Tax=Sansalvadorimonas verongulae TaxID=2172824 RepID=UPI0012BBA304|nr:contractile injection system protein, VgrG/Pvc8 family [Sansalvadorimonas verongulae]MTI13431.1 hypothetical protein [Sansalvadorimonas verongulae]
MIPVFEITANKESVTDAIKDRFESLDISDAEGYESDQMTLVLHDQPDEHGQYIELPAKGVLLEVALGYRIADKVSVYPAGRWVVDEVTPSGGPSGDIITITANGADTDSAIKDRKTRSFKNITLPGVLETIASEHKLTPRIADAFQSVAIDQLDQTNESDLNLITRLARDNDAVGKLVGDTLVFTQRNTGTNSEGKKLSAVDIHRTDIKQWSLQGPSADKFNTVIARWYDVRKGMHFEESAGEGEPVLRLPKVYPSANTANEAARARFKKSKSTGQVLNLSGHVPVGGLMLVETPLNVTGLRKEANGAWRVQTQSLSLSGSGFTFSLTAVEIDPSHQR